MTEPFKITNCGLIVASLGNFLIKAVFPTEAVLQNNMSLISAFISGDSSYLLQLIYVHLLKEISPFKILVDCIMKLNS